MTITMPYWGLVALICLGGMVGWLITSLAYNSPGPGEDITRPSGQRSRLPRPGYLILDDPDPWGTVLAPPPGWDRTPAAGFTSDHYAQLAAHEREIYQMIDNYPYRPY